MPVVDFNLLSESRAYHATSVARPQQLLNSSSANFDPIVVSEKAITASVGRSTTEWLKGSIFDATSVGYICVTTTYAQPVPVNYTSFPSYTSVRLQTNSERAPATPLPVSDAKNALSLDSVIINKLVELLMDPEFDENGDRLRPVNYAFDRALTLWSQTSVELSGSMPKAFITTDRLGGIRFEWQKGARDVRVICPATKQESAYLYWQEGKSYQLEWNVRPSTLANRLEWLRGRD